MSIIAGLIAAIGALVAAFFFQKSKADTASALNENVKTKEDLLKADQKIAANNAGTEQEEINRQKLLEDLKKGSDEKLSSNNVVDFFNNRK